MEILDDMIPKSCCSELCSLEEAKLKLRRLHSFLMLALAFCLCSLPATAGVLFTDLGPAGDLYWAAPPPRFLFWGSSSSVGTYFGTSFSVANPFTVLGSGSLAVGEIDLAVGYI